MEIGEAHCAVTPWLEVVLRSQGPGDGHPVFMLHGWPDSARTWQGVALALPGEGFRMLIPSLRGFAGTRFRQPGTMRSGQLAALGRDLVDVADAMGLERFAVVGHDWGLERPTSRRAFDLSE